MQVFINFTKTSLFYQSSHIKSLGMLKKISLLVLLIIYSTIITAQTISNIEVKTDENRIIINYNLIFNNSVTIELYLSEDNGKKWEGPLKSVSGDVGENISAGQKQIIWDVLKDKEIFAFENVIFKVKGFSIYGSVTDQRDNKTYSTKIINSQEWMLENLDYKSLSGSWYYKDDSSAFSKYGRLYDWITAKNVCPFGWHLPADLEWETLFKSLGGLKIAGGKLKSVFGWVSPNTAATDENKFGILPGGCRKSNGIFTDEGISANLWTSSSDDPDYSTSVLFKNVNQDVRLVSHFKDFGMNVRCVRHWNSSIQDSGTQ
jgi:uncharacterized protein (TIGR02145 family)